MKKYFRNIDYFLTLITISAIVGICLILIYEHSNRTGNVILLITAYIVAIYTREAYRQRVISNNQLNNQFMPIIVPHGYSHLLQGPNLNFEVKNVGLGLATKVTMTIDNLVYPQNVQVRPKDMQQYLSASDNKLQELLEKKKKILIMKLSYDDINDQSYEISGLHWILDEADMGIRYRLDQKNWKLTKI
jgi:hypothetical protein